MELGDRYLGISCAHVFSSALKHEKVKEESLITKVFDSGMDMAFFYLEVPKGEVWRNIIPLVHIPEVLGSISTGEDVYKIGSATGLTIGSFVSASSYYHCRSSAMVYKRCVEVAWKHGREPFAFHGDCGALYCVKRGGGFAPIAIHKISGDQRSYGSKFCDAIEIASAELDGSPNFINPPYWKFDDSMIQPTTEDGPPITNINE